MDDDYYTILEVPRSASSADIQAAYRKLARKYHPDVNPDDASAKEKFQKVQRAFDVLNDAKKREMYDRYGSAFDQAGQGGGPRPGQGSWQTGPGGGGFEDFDFSQFFGGGMGGGPGGSPGGEGMGGGGFADILRKFGGGGGAAAGKGGSRRGEDLHHEIQIAFQTAIKGGELDLAVTRGSGHETIRVKIPAGVDNGQKIRLRGQGGPAPRRGEPGDLIITVHVAPHPSYTRRGSDLEVSVPVTIAEAALGAKIDVPTPDGTITLTIPKGTSSGKKLRLKGRGVATKSGTGDLYAEIQVVVPERLDKDGEALVEKLAAYGPADPRGELKW